MNVREALRLILLNMCQTCVDILDPEQIEFPVEEREVPPEVAIYWTYFNQQIYKKWSGR